MLSRKTFLSAAATATKNPQPNSNPKSVTHILHPDKFDAAGGGDDQRPSAAGAVPPPRPSAPPYHAAASTASRNPSELVAGNSKWYVNPLDVWSRAGSSSAGGGPGGSGKSVQFATGTEQYAENVSFVMSKTIVSEISLPPGRESIHFVGTLSSDSMKRKFPDFCCGF